VERSPRCTASAARAGLAAGVLLALAAGCGGTGSGVTAAAATAQRQFAANAAGIIGQLHADLTISEQQASSVSTARRTLQNGPDLLATLVAFTDFGSCRQMVENAGRPTGKLVRVQSTLRS